MILADKEYVNGVFSCESTYTVSAEDDHIPVTQTTWNDDGSTSVNEYDEYGNCIRSIIQTEDGAVTFETISEFALNDEGYYYECKTTSRFDSGETFYKETNQYDDTIRTLNTYADGSVVSVKTYEYVCSEDMEQRAIRECTDGVLTMETIFHYDEEFGFFGSTESLYNADGTRTVNEYDDMLALVSTVEYAADSSINTDADSEGR